MAWLDCIFSEVRQRRNFSFLVRMNCLNTQDYDYSSFNIGGQGGTIILFVTVVDTYGRDLFHFEFKIASYEAFFSCYMQKWSHLPKLSYRGYPNGSIAWDELLLSILECSQQKWGALGRLNHDSQIIASYEAVMTKNWNQAIFFLLYTLYSGYVH